MRRPLTLALLATTFALPASATLAPGAVAPDFTAQGAVAGRPFTVRLSQLLRRGPVVLYFFPAAFTGGCNAEARAFAEKVDEFRAAGATVIGMSADNLADLTRFSAQECAGKFAVATATPQVIAGYDVSLGRQIQGRAVTNRTSYVIGRDRHVTYVHSELSPVDHVANTLAAVHKLTGR